MFWEFEMTNVAGTTSLSINGALLIRISNLRLSLSSVHLSTMQPSFPPLASIIAMKFAARRCIYDKD